MVTLSFLGGGMNDGIRQRRRMPAAPSLNVIEQNYVVNTKTGRVSTPQSKGLSI